MLIIRLAVMVLWCLVARHSATCESCPTWFRWVSLAMVTLATLEICA